MAAARAPRIAPVDAVMLIAYALEAGAHGFGLAELSMLHLGHTAIAQDSITGSGRGRLAYAAVALDRATAQMGELADIVLRLWRTLRPRLRVNQALGVYEQVDRRLIRVLMDAEGAGGARGCNGTAAPVGRFRRTHGGHGDAHPCARRPEL